MKKEAVIIDVDGTVADCNHRRGELPNWGKFFSKMDKDPPIEPVVKLVRMLLATAPKVFFVSGRPDNWWQVTQNWLVENVGPLYSAELIMRKENDTRPDYVVKKEILEGIRARGYDPYLSIDDRSSVVSMWRENGVFCLQCPDQTLSLNPGEVTPFIPVKGECLLTVMVGPAGGGKSTYAEKHFHSASILSSDQLRAEITGDFTNQSKNVEVFRAFHDVARVRLRNGLPVVLDATHIKRKDRLASASLAPAGSVVRYVVVNRPLETKLREPGWRPEDLIRKHEQTFQSNLKDILEGDYLSNVVVIPEIDGGSKWLKKVA